MSSEETKTPSRRKLLLVGVIVLVMAGAVAAGGILTRAKTSRDLAQWTNQQAVPTVALAQLKPGDQYQSLRLPGTIQAFRKAAIYARVSGYLKSWTLDIGARVQPGQVLAEIDTPDLDQQLAQAKATYASAQASSQLAASPSGRTSHDDVRRAMRCDARRAITAVDKYRPKGDQ